MRLVRRFVVSLIIQCLETRKRKEPHRIDLIATTPYVIVTEDKVADEQLEELRDDSPLLPDNTPRQTVRPRR